MSKKVYIDTTVVSYLVARPSRDIIVAARQQATREFWPKVTKEFEPFISALVYQEAASGKREQAEKRLKAVEDFPLLAIDEEVKALAKIILDAKAIPREYPEDALHVAVAAVNGMDLIVTWNFAHLNNPFTKMKIRRVLEKAGYQSPEICSPDQLLEK